MDGPRSEDLGIKRQVLLGRVVITYILGSKYLVVHMYGKLNLINEHGKIHVSSRCASYIK